MKKVIAIFILCITLSLPCFSSDIKANDYCNSGLKKLELENYQGSIEDYDKAVQLEPSNYDAYLNRGRCKYALKDYNNAIADFTIAIKINPNCNKAYSYRGQAKNRLKDYEGSIEDCTKAIQLDSSSEWAYLSRSESRKELKDFKGAEEDRKKFDELTSYFKPYIKNITKIINSNWDPPFKTIGTSTIARYEINKKGEISHMQIIKSSGILQNDESAIKALEESSPLPPLPIEFQGSSLDIEFHFDINPAM